MNKFSVLGKDERSNYIRKEYIKEGIKMVDYKEADYIIAPIPFSRDGIYINTECIKCDEFVSDIKGKTLFSGSILPDIKNSLNENNICFYDLMEEDDVAILNAIPTAEGAIFEAIKNSVTTLNGSNSLVLGYGRIGKVLSNMLKGMGANVFCEARKKKDFAYISAYGYNVVHLEDLEKVIGNMDYIFNTIPVKILNKSYLEKVKEDVVIIDLASNPGGVDFEEAKRKNLNVTWALSLPSKVAPKTAGLYLKNKIDSIIFKV